jgi:hypothetical protein
VRAEVGARVGRAVARLRALEGVEVGGRVRLGARCGRPPRGDAVVGRAAGRAGQGAAVGHAVHGVHAVHVVCGRGGRRARVGGRCGEHGGLGSVLLYRGSSSSSGLCLGWSSHRRGP